jgi:hypothetical protein
LAVFGLLVYKLGFRIDLLIRPFYICIFAELSVRLH